MTEVDISYFYNIQLVEGNVAFLYHSFIVVD